MICPRCYEETPALTHRVTSDIIRITVCYDCGVEAQLINRRMGKNGHMTITLVDLTPMQRLLYLTLDKKGAVDPLLIALYFAAWIFLFLFFYVAFFKCSLSCSYTLVC